MDAQRAVKEWDVYIRGKYVGTVHETKEEFARCAALSKFVDEDDFDGEDLSVSVRQ